MQNEKWETKYIFQDQLLQLKQNPTCWLIFGSIPVKIPPANQFSMLDVAYVYGASKSPYECAVWYNVSHISCGKLSSNAKEACPFSLLKAKNQCSKFDLNKHLKFTNDICSERWCSL